MSEGLQSIMKQQAHPDPPQQGNFGGATDYSHRSGYRGSFHEGRGGRGGYNNRFQGGQRSSYRGGYRNQYQGRYNDNTSGNSNSQEGYTALPPPASRLQIVTNTQPAQSAMTPNPSTALAVQPVAKREFQNSSRECSRNPCFNLKCRFEHKTGQHRCKYRPCCRESCTMSHDLGQHCPDKNEIDRKIAFTQQGKCKWNHDGTCDRDCGRVHGKHKANGAACPHVGAGMCTDFFTLAGCQKSHQQLRGDGRRLGQ